MKHLISHTSKQTRCTLEYHSLPLIVMGISTESNEEQERITCRALGYLCEHPFLFAVTCDYILNGLITLENHFLHLSENMHLIVLFLCVQVTIVLTYRPAS